MKRNFFFALIAIFFFSLSTSAQVSLQNNSVVRCYTVEYMNELRKGKPNAETDQQFENWLRNLVNNSTSRTNIVYNLPVVFHIIHNSEVEGTGLNIATATVQAQLNQLNKDFNNQAGSQYAVAASGDIRFRMAQKDNFGNDLAIPGIDRIDRNLRGWTDPGTTGWTSAYINANIKPSTIWDPLKFINIWICPVGGGILGYATFPVSSGLPGLFTGEDNTNAGVVVTSSSVGGVVTPNTTTCTNVYNTGRTMTHELGHFFGLRHIWGDATCGSDFVDDTPIHEAANYGVPVHPKPNTCGTADEMFENFMDYVDDRVPNTFSTGQVARMQAVMLNSPRRKELATSTAGLVTVPSNKISFHACANSSTVSEKGTTASFPWYRDVPVVLHVENAASAAATATVTATGTAISGTDYQLLTPSLSFVAGDAFKIITVRILDDAIPETNKTIILNYSVSGTGVVPTATNQTFTINLMDDDQIRPAENALTILAQDFGTTGGLYPSGWSSLTNGGPNSFVISTNGSAGGSGQVAHITNNTSTKPNTYTKTTAALAVIRTPLIDAAGLTNLTFSYKYTGAGEVFNGTAYDYAYSAYATEAAGTSFFLVPNADLLGSNTAVSGTALNALPSSFNNTRFYLGVLWRNDNVDGNDPGINIDDVVLTATGTQIETALNASNTFAVAPATINQFKSSQNAKIMATISNVSTTVPQLTVSVVEAGNDRPTVNTQTGTYLRARKVYQVTPPGGDNTTTYTATFYYTPAEMAAWGASVNSIRILKVGNTTNLSSTLSSADGVIVTPTSVDNKLTTDGYISFTATFTGFSKFVLVEQSTVLPVRWLDFTGVLAGNIIKLNWKTTSEINNRGFDIERSTDGTNFAKIGFLSAQNGNGLNNYNFDDADLVMGNRYYYRLKQIDIDSRTSYSPVVNIAYLGKEGFTWYPNPVKNILVIQNNGAAKNETIMITDLAGRVIYKSQMQASGKIEISTVRWSPGMYTVSVSGEKEPVIFKIVKD